MYINFQLCRSGGNRLHADEVMKCRMVRYGQ